jgi:hypothetical protein
MQQARWWHVLGIGERGEAMENDLENQCTWQNEDPFVEIRT